MQQNNNISLLTLALIPDLDKQHYDNEHEYLSLLKEIMDNGTETMGRNGTTKRLFSRQLKFIIRDGLIPLLTTKKMFVRGIIEELLFFIRGQTDTTLLESLNVNIWKGNTRREFLDSVGLTEYKEGDMGAMYGFQWRHFGADYKGCQYDYTGQGYDQLAEVVSALKEIKEGRRNIGDRRLIITALNPPYHKKMCLYPCHCSYQFYVDENGLSCQLYQRSADMFLGVPFNIVSASILTSLIAKLVNMRPYMISVVMCDCHIYKEHYEAVKKQLTRIPLGFPKMLINKMNGELKTIEDLENLKPRDFEIIGYQHHGAISAEMVA